MSESRDGLGLYRAAFWVGAIYDMVLGVAFFFFWEAIFNTLGVDPPEHTSYIHITAAYVFMQGLGYVYVARNMLRNLDIVRLGIIYKAIYIGMAVYYIAIDELIHEVFAWFAVFDAIFLVLFVAYLLPARGRERERYAAG